MVNSLFTVKGKPFFSIGGQTNNSTGYDAGHMQRALLAAKNAGMNTIAAPVYWEILEKKEGVFDFTQADMLVEMSREAGLHLVILWFGTWKNGNSHYVPEWVKTDHERFIWACGADGTPVRTISPHCKNALEADKKAFLALCGHVEEINEDETVIAIQVENEPGIIGTARDYGSRATELFCQPVPQPVAEYAGKTGTWEEIFGFDGAEFFSAYAIACYIDEIVAAAREVTKLPIYTNVWLGEMHNRIAGVDYPSGGAVTKTIGLFRIGAPHLDAIAPDIYLQDQETWDALNEAYQDGVHPYYLPESIPGALSVTRSIQAVVEHGLCGVHFFGVDMMCAPDGTILDYFKEAADGMGILKEMKPLIEKYQGTDKLYAVAQYEGMSEKYIDFGDYIGSVRFENPNQDLMAKHTDRNMDNRHSTFFAPAGPPVRGKGVICYEGQGTFYLAGSGYRLMLFPKKRIEWATNAAHSADFLNQRCQPFLSVEEGHLDEECKFSPVVRRNGDEADYGFWVTPDVGVVRVRLDKAF
ncbi:MAG: DUF5597 domain-containing protein [Roseburia sp.]|jgi:hypothetical protein|nr:DUF5597 domain-containing protein [Roseburia sp.]